MAYSLLTIIRELNSRVYLVYALIISQSIIQWEAHCCHIMQILTFSDYGVSVVLNQTMSSVVVFRLLKRVLSGATRKNNNTRKSLILFLTYSVMGNCKKGYRLSSIIVVEQIRFSIDNGNKIRRELLFF